MKKTFLFSMLALSSIIYADEALIADAQYMSGKVEPARPAKSNNNSNGNHMMSVTTLTSANPESEFGWYLFADALYWHVDIGSTDWATVNDNSNPPITKVHNHALDFKWNWGFRAGIGANTSHDMWDMNFYYTWLYASNSNNAGKNGAAVVDQIGIGSVVPQRSGSTKWDLHFSMFDWEMGRWSYFSKKLALRPRIGVKGGWIHQQVHTRFRNQGETFISDNGIHFNERFKNNFWGVGPAAGFGSMWIMGFAGKTMQHRFCLTGDFGGSLMYGHFEVRNNQRGVDNDGNPIFGISQGGLTRNRVAAMLQAMMGLSWDLSFNQDKNHFMFNLGYEFQYWFRQNQLVQSFIQTEPVAVINRRIADDLALQGISARFRFDF